MMGVKIAAPVRDAKNRTGNTALSFNESFLATSYNPNKKHETSPKKIHIAGMLF
jgi:hypothetical protein